MRKFDLKKIEDMFFIRLYTRGLTSPSGANKVAPNSWWRVKDSNQRGNEDKVVIGNIVVAKEDLHDFLCDKGEEVVSRPRRRRGNK